MRSFYLGTGTWPDELVDLLLMKRLRCTYDELVDQPAIIVGDAYMDLAAESTVAKSKQSWAKR